MNPDGTQQQILYGGSVRSEARAGQLVYSKCDLMPIPGADKFVCVFSPPHGLPENAGDVAVIDVKRMQSFAMTMTGETQSCFGCHDSAANIGRRVRKSRMNSPKCFWNLYNLSHPEKSMSLLAPLSREAGGSLRDCPVADST